MVFRARKSSSSATPPSAPRSNAPASPRWPHRPLPMCCRRSRPSTSGKKATPMAEIERTHERERPTLQDNPYERTLKWRREQAERNQSGPIVIKRSEREVFMARQGRLRYFLDPLFYPEVPLLH